MYAARNPPQPKISGTSLTRGNGRGKAQKKKNSMIRAPNRQTELKYIDAATFVASVISTTMNTTYMSAITQGSNVSNRVGIQIEAHRLDYRLAFVTGDATNVIRFMVLVDTIPQGATFAQSDLFLVGGIASLMPAWENNHRFIVLHDEFLSVDTYNPQKTRTGTVDLQGIQVRYQGTTNNISAARANAIYVLFLSDSGAVPQPTVSGDIRFWFKDE